MPETPVLRTSTFERLPREALELLYENPNWKKAIAAEQINLEDSIVFLHPDGSLELRTINQHHRSVDIPLKKPLSPTSIPTQQARTFCYFDVKGVGFIHPETHASKKDSIEAGALRDYPEAYIISGSQETPWGYDALGLFDERMALTSVKKAEELADLGMRTEELVALYRINRLFVGGKEVTVKSFITESRGRLIDESKRVRERFQSLSKHLKANRTEKKQLELESALQDHQVLVEGARDITKNFQPVIGIRLMRSVFRVRDFRDASNNHEAKLILDEAMDRLNQEALAIGEEPPGFCLEQPEKRELFIRFICYWYGKNLGILQGSGRSHQFLHMGNLTLAGEIVDLDSVAKVLRTRKDRVYLAEGANNFRATHPRFLIPNCLIKDIRDMVISIKKLLKKFKDIGYPIPDKRVACQAFIDGFTNGFGEQEPFTGIGISGARMKDIARTIVTEAIIDQIRYPTIPVDGATDSTSDEG